MVGEIDTEHLVCRMVIRAMVKLGRSAREGAAILNRMVREGLLKVSKD